MTLIDARGARFAAISLCVAALVACVVPSPTGTPARETPTPGNPSPTPTPTVTEPAPTMAQATPTAIPATSTTVPATTTTAPAPCTSTPAVQAPSPTPAAVLEDLEQQMLEAVNRERNTYDLPPYRLDQVLATVARDHALDMAARGYWGHVTPEGKTYRDRLAEQDLEPNWAGENYYYGYYPAAEIVETALAWFMDDPPHRDNILHEHCTRIGIGIVEGPQGAYTLVLDFAGE